MKSQKTSFYSNKQRISINYEKEKITRKKVNIFFDEEKFNLELPTGEIIKGKLSFIGIAEDGVTKQYKTDKGCPFTFAPNQIFVNLGNTHNLYCIFYLSEAKTQGKIMPNNKNKSIAIILSLLLGGLGIHQFYLGKSLKGIFYLLFCWTFIPLLIAFFDFIMLLSMSQEKFDLKYNNDNKRTSALSINKRKKIIKGLENYLNEYPNATEESLKFTREILPKILSDNELIKDKIQNFIYKQILASGMEEKTKIKFYIKNGLNFIPENFDHLFNQIYFSTLVDEFLSDEALDPNEIKTLIKKAKELGIQKYEDEEAIREDYGYYIKNWEFDNGIFQEVQADFIMNKNEICIYQNPKAELLEQKEVINRINYAGPRARIKIAKGLNYNLGSYNYSTNKEVKKISKGVGILNVTTKRILFKASQKSTTIRLQSIIDMEPYSDGLMIYKSTGNPLIIKDSNGVDLYQAVNGAIRNLNK